MRGPSEGRTLTPLPSPLLLLRGVSRWLTNCSSRPQSERRWERWGGGQPRHASSAALAKLFSNPLTCRPDRSIECTSSRSTRRDHSRCPAPPTRRFFAPRPRRRRRSLAIFAPFRVVSDEPCAAAARSRRRTPNARSENVRKHLERNCEKFKGRPNLAHWLRRVRAPYVERGARRRSCLVSRPPGRDRDRQRDRTRGERNGREETQTVRLVVSARAGSRAASSAAATARAAAARSRSRRRRPRPRSPPRTRALSRRSHEKKDVARTDLGS